MNFNTQSNEIDFTVNTMPNEINSTIIQDPHISHKFCIKITITLNYIAKKTFIENEIEHTCAKKQRLGAYRSHNSARFHKAGASCRLGRTF